MVTDTSPEAARVRTAALAAMSGSERMDAALALSDSVQAYVGAGWMYEKVTLVQDNNEVFDGDDWGINLLLGNRLSSSSRVQPFIEIRISLMRELADQLAFSGGVRVPLGG